MEENNQSVIRNDLQQIIDMLILNATLVSCPGLVHGKMGIAIFFFQYARFTNNILFADYALDLIEEIQKQIHINSPVDYERGIAGIGVGIEYLIRNDYLNVEDDIFEDFDDRMYRAVMYNTCTNFDLYDGLTGYGRYWISRLRQQPLCVEARECLQYITKQIKDKLLDIPVQEQTDIYTFLHDLQELTVFDYPVVCLGEIKKLPAVINWETPRFDNSIIGDIIRIYQQKLYFDNMLPDGVYMVLKQIPILNKEISPTRIGLLTGYAGEGLLRLITLDQTNISLMRLL